MKKYIRLSLFITVVIIFAAAIAAESTHYLSGGAKSAGFEKGAQRMKNGIADAAYVKKDGVGVIYLAGGCFWGLEKLMESLPGVISAVSGYANGNPDITPTYELVCTGKTGYHHRITFL